MRIQPRKRQAFYHHAPFPHASRASFWIPHPSWGMFLARGARHSLAQISRPRKYRHHLFRGTSTSTARTAHRHRNRLAHAPHLGGGRGRGGKGR
eukprot:4420420-Pyramimonas_sp.AAC.1